jgi:uncharacterized protein (DUF1778 family)
MTLTLEISPEAQAQIERAAAQEQTDVRAFILTAAAEKAARVFDEPRFGDLLESDPLAALDYLVETGRELTAGALPLADDAVARSYADYHDEREAA